MYNRLFANISKHMDYYILFAKSCKFWTEPEFTYNHKA